MEGSPLLCIRCDLFAGLGSVQARAARGPQGVATSQSGGHASHPAVPQHGQLEPVCLLCIWVKALVCNSGGALITLVLIPAVRIPNITNKCDPTQELGSIPFLLSWSRFLIRIFLQFAFSIDLELVPLLIPGKSHQGFFFIHGY
jgi:hypothetical protein